MPAAWRSRPIRSCRIRCAPRAGSFAGCSFDPDPAVRPDAIETFNPTMLGKPWHARVTRFADEHGLPHLGNSDAHALAAIGTGWSRFPGRTAEDLRAAIETRTTEHGGTFHPVTGQLETFGLQLRKRSRDAATSSGAASSAMERAATTAIPAAGSARRASSRTPDEDRPRLPVHLPRIRRRGAARPVPLREPPAARPRRPDHHRQSRAATCLRRRHPAHRCRVQHADQRLGRDADVLAAVSRPGPGAPGARAVRPAPLPRAVRAVPVALPPARVAERQRRHVPCVCRVLAVLRARAAGSCAVTPRGCTAGSRSAPPRATSSTASSRATTRSSRTASTSAGSPPRCHCRAGRTARRTCSSSGGSNPARASSISSRRTGSCARPARATGS